MPIGGGWNPAALVAFARRRAAQPARLPQDSRARRLRLDRPAWAAAYTYAWFIGLAIALALYAALTWRRRAPVEPAASAGLGDAEKNSP